MLSAYQALSTSNNFKYDYAQVNAVAKLDDLSEQIYQHERKSWLAKRLKKSSAIRGIYLYGRVGRGKTMLMDLFFQNLAVTAKKRIHFHRFIEEVHQQLNLCTGQSDPLTFIAKQWAKKIKVLCFDEFYVSDIGDAMLLSGLFQAFFQQDIILIATSNCRPEELYRNGLQRERFLPTIDLINHYCQVLSVDGAVDHRLEHYDETAIAYRDYTYPLNNKTLRQRFLDITGIVGTSGNVTVNHRKIPF
jgi:cell division protein ZapE